MSTRVHNIKRTIRNINEIEDKVEQALARGLDDHAQGVFTESLRLVPVKTGALQDSGRKLAPIQNTRNNWVVRITYGGGVAAAYAVRQHEELGYRHDPPQQAKYLEEPAKENSRKFSVDIIRQIKKVL